MGFYLLQLLYILFIKNYENFYENSDMDPIAVVGDRPLVLHLKLYNGKYLRYHLSGF